jgi:hypothetical protein
MLSGRKIQLVEVLVLDEEVVDEDEVVKLKLQVIV